MRKQEIREKLFDIYAINLSQAVPGIRDTFRCPICLRDFNRSDLEADQALTLGHIIPDALGGSIYTLECGKCNSSIGAAYDSHAANMKKFRDWLNMKEGAEKFVRISDGVSTVSAMASWEADHKLVIKATDWEDPNYKEQAKRMFLQQNNPSFTLNLNSKSIPERETISTIHSAFLMMFYCFGYEYLLSSEADIIRTIINEHKAPWDIRKMVADMMETLPFPIPAAGVIREPQDIKSFIVILPNPEDAERARIVFFPGR
ncbi:MAG TPA: HNH endonuclease, partial [Methanotrichaceae archaeon]|nr:HNH endonuclease [Methanotrichaceae archaeon]